MKKLLGIMMVTVLLMAGCAKDAKIPDLSGEWVGEEQVATISGDTIMVYWGSDDAKALYWAGSFIPPTEPGKYTWISVNDKDKTSEALLASGDDEKIFTYENGVLSYQMSVMGVESNIKLKQVK